MTLCRELSAYENRKNKSPSSSQVEVDFFQLLERRTKIIVQQTMVFTLSNLRMVRKRLLEAGQLPLQCALIALNQALAVAGKYARRA